ncbi:AraC family transcriptional regulator [Kiritimatiellaeota bacterium B1221]|nr:AraC family transcriptional regulator [Kiritimatiellaeota bacterium B1221]
MKIDKPFESLPDIPLVQMERYTKCNYFWDNSVRKKGEGAVVQLTLKGSAYYEDRQGRRRVGPGEAMIFQFEEESVYGLDDACELPYEFCWISLTGGAGLLSLVQEIRSLFGSVVQMKEKGEAGQLLLRLHQDFISGNVRDRLYLADCAYRLLISLYREQIADIQGIDPISYGRHLLETQFRSPRNLKEWADEIGISREHFTREFRTRYGETPACFLRRLRLEHAQVLLRNHSLNLPDVATASGFASPQTFYRAYKNHFGVAAGQQR